MFSILSGIKSGPAALEMLIFSNNFCTPFKVIDKFPIDGYLLPNNVGVSPRQSLLSLHMTKSYVRTATRSTLKVEANLTQILNFKANFHTEFEPFFKKKNYANNGGHFKIVSIKIKN